MFYHLHVMPFFLKPGPRPPSQFTSPVPGLLADSGLTFVSCPCEQLQDHALAGLCSHWPALDATQPPWAPPHPSPPLRSLKLGTESDCTPPLPPSGPRCCSAGWRLPVQQAASIPSIPGENSVERRCRYKCAEQAEEADFFRGPATLRHEHGNLLLY